MLNRSLDKAAHFMSGQGTTLILIAAIICGSLIGKFSPEVTRFLSEQIDYSILLLVFFLLFETRFQNFSPNLKQLYFIAAAIVANFVIIPALGFLIASLFLSGHPLFFIGLLIYFMAPCTDWFLGFTRLARGNTQLGAALLPINMIIQLLLYPVYLHIFGIDAVATNASNITQVLWQWFLVPLLLAVCLRFIVERVAPQNILNLIHSLTAIIIPVLLAVLIGQIFASNIGTMTSHLAIIPTLLIAIFLFFTMTYLISEIISKVMKLDYKDRVLMTMTTGARNAPLMLAITIAVLPNQPVIYAAIIIGTLIEFPHLIALKTILNRQRKTNALLIDGLSDAGADKRT